MTLLGDGECWLCASGQAELWPRSHKSREAAEAAGFGVCRVSTAQQLLLCTLSFLMASKPWLSASPAASSPAGMHSQKVFRQRQTRFSTRSNLYSQCKEALKLCWMKLLIKEM